MEDYKYELLWRNKWLTSHAKSLDDMINSLQLAVNDLKEMKEAGIVLSDNGGVSDDYAFLLTNDKKVADRFCFSEIEYDDEEDEEEFEDNDFEDDETEESEEE